MCSSTISTSQLISQDSTMCYVGSVDRERYGVTTSNDGWITNDRGTLLPSKVTGSEMSSSSSSSSGPTKDIIWDVIIIWEDIIIIGIRISHHGEITGRSNSGVSGLPGPGGVWWTRWFWDIEFLLRTTTDKNNSQFL